MDHSTVNSNDLSLSRNGLSLFLLPPNDDGDTVQFQAGQPVEPEARLCFVIRSGEQVDAPIKRDELILLASND